MEQHWTQPMLAAPLNFISSLSPPAVFHSIQKCFDGMKTKEGRRTANKTNQLTNEIKLFNFMELMVCLVGAPQQLNLSTPINQMSLIGWWERDESWLLRCGRQRPIRSFINKSNSISFHLIYFFIHSIAGGSEPATNSFTINAFLFMNVVCLFTPPALIRHSPIKTIRFIIDSFSFHQ